MLDVVDCLQALLDDLVTFLQVPDENSQFNDLLFQVLDLCFLLLEPFVPGLGETGDDQEQTAASEQDRG